MTAESIETGTLALPKRFELDREIGRGGMAVVYRAHDNHLGRFVAIKVLSSGLSNTVGADRFQREIALMAKLVHPGIVALFDSGEASGQLFYVMPLVVGETLRARLTRERRLLPSEAASLGADIAEALAYAHGVGIVHRDVKPENIFTVGGRAVLADFGIARLTGEESLSGSLTVSGMLLGTLSYMSPEQAGGELLVDGRSDLYSLGCVLYELLTGAPPFEAPTVMALIGKHMVEAPVPPSARGVALSAELENITLQLLAKDAVERPDNAGDVARLLRSASHTSSIPASSGLKRASNVSDYTDEHLVVRVRIGAIDVLGNDTENEDIADGLRHAIGSALWALPNVQLQGEPPVETSQSDSGVSTRDVVTVTGTVRRAAERVRISVRVTDGSGVLNLSQNVDGTTLDLFALEDAVADSVVDHFKTRALRSPAFEKLQGRVSRHQHPPSRSSIQREADQLVVEGVRAFNKFGPTGGAAAKSHMEESKAYITRALDLDPKNVRALVALGNWYAVAAVSGMGDREELLARCRELTYAALAADDQCADVHTSMSKMALYHDDDFHTAARHIRRAIEIDPNEPEALRLLSIVNKILGRHEESVQAARTATEQAPDSAPLWNTLADSLLAAGRNAEAADALKHAIALLPGYGPALERLELAHSRLGEHQLALETRITRMRLAKQTERAEVLEREWEHMNPAEVIQHDVRSELEKLLADAKTVDPFLNSVRRTVADRIVSAHAALGEWKEAMDWVQRSYEQRPGRLWRMLSDLPVDYRGLAVDPRYARLMRVAGMEAVM